ncbi:MAG: tetratricopeptide repeat protein, partial [Myxococcota bacterium]|nr:tetratricopeptide repeat protein [Myxococcota bacterium]
MNDWSMLPAMPFPRRLRTLAVVACAAVAAAAPQIGLAEETSTANVTAARKHFEKARAYYGQGAYRDAVNELEAAHALDSNAKDLVFNLGVVHEKLSDIEEALKWFRLYTTMDLVPQERERADAYVRRLEGAKKELDEKQAIQQQSAQEIAQPNAESASSLAHAPTPSSTTLRTPPAPEINRTPATTQMLSGRMDGLTIGAAGLSAAGLVFGAIMGVKAVQDRVSANSVTTSERGYPFAQLQADVAAAHREAIL